MLMFCATRNKGAGLIEKAVKKVGAVFLRDTELVNNRKELVNQVAA